MPVLDTSGYEFHEPPISWGRLTFGIGDDQVTLQIGKMLREVYDIGMKKSANTGVEGANCVDDHDDRTCRPTNSATCSNCVIS